MSANAGRHGGKAIVSAVPRPAAWPSTCFRQVAGADAVCAFAAGLLAPAVRFGAFLPIDHPELSGARQLIKGVFDRVTALSALILLAPVFAAVALVIRVADGAPVFSRQTRVGRDGDTFTVCKFRTTVVDAGQRKARPAARNEAAGTLSEIRRDPRLTRTGGKLRRWSMDELPQLINVLRGDMSLVGPGPALPDETARYAHYVRCRLAVKPGITGLWQVNGRSELPWDEAVRLDLRYVENWSFALDLQILWKTTSAVFRGNGAY